MAIADINVDGWPDLLVANSGELSVSVLFGKGDGTFQPRVNTDVGGYPTSLAVQDVDGDGRPDFATALRTTDHVLTYLGNGDGTFVLSGNVYTGNVTYPDFVALGDLNGDGKADLVATLGYASALVVSLGNGDGSYVSSSIIQIPRTANSVAIADLNGDGRADLVTANGGADSNALLVLIGNGDGTFGPATEYHAAGAPNRVAVGDLNRDGRLDVVTANGGLPATVSILLGNGDGTLGASREYPGGWYDVAIGDVNGDGKPDLVSAGSSDKVVILLGRGDGTFDANGEYPTGGDPLSVGIGDLDGDRRLDVVTANQVTSNVSVLLNIGPPNGSPDCQAARALVPVIWPPNDRMTPVTISGVTDPDGDPVTIVVTDVTQDEPLGAGGEDVNGEGDKTHCPDASIDPDLGASLRAERSARGNGRVYTVHFTATDPLGAACAGTVRVCVPHDPGHPECVDDGQVFHSLGPCPERQHSREASLEAIAGRRGGLVSFEFVQPVAGEVSVSLYDVSGRRIATLERGWREAGRHAITWDASGLTGGIYFYRVETGTTSWSKSVLIMK